MRVVMELWRRLRLLGRGGFERGLDDELRFHLDQQTEKHRRAGLPDDEARRQAHIALGGVERVKEGVRDQVRFAALEHLLRDLRLAGRALRRVPGFTVVIVVTLGLGIGASTAMFSVVHGVLLRPLPYPDPDRLVELVHEAPGLGIEELFASPAVYFGYADHTRTMGAVGLWDWDRSPVTVDGPAGPEAVRSVEVTHEVLSMLGATPILGRTFTAADDRPGAAATVVLAHGYWQRRFGGEDPVGEVLLVDGVPRTVIGVLPASFAFFDYPAEVFAPLPLVRAEAVFPSGEGRGLARLTPGTSLAAAQEDAERMIPLLDAEYPGGDAAAWGYAPRLRRLQESVVGDLGDTLWLLMGTIGLLLVIACANVATLTVVRTETRRQAFAVRSALGAGPGAVARVVLAEGIVLGLAGGLAGIGLAQLGLPWLLRLGAADLPTIQTVRMDPVVLGFASIVSLGTTLACSLAPALHVAVGRRGPTGTLRSADRSATAGRPRQRLRHGLVVAQVALTLVLLVGAGLMLRTFQALRAVDPGFRAGHEVQTFQLTLPRQDGTSGAGEPSDDRSALPVQRRVAEALRAIPGVEAAGFSSANDGLPLDGDGRAAPITVEGRPDTGLDAVREIQYVSPGFFETLRTPLLAGRPIEWTDVEPGRPVVIVSENLARREWGSVRAALGQRLALGSSDAWREVVGVVRDVRHAGLTEPAPEVVVFPAAPAETATFVVRAARAGSSAFADDMRAAVRSVRPDAAPAQLRTLGDLRQGAMGRTTTTLQLLVIAGALALALGTMGIYGLVSYAVTARRREIGIRVALGARLGEVRRMFVRRALGLVALGVGCGAVVAAGLTRVAASQLFGVSPLDPWVYAAVAGGLLAAAGLASSISARRGAAVDPVEILQADG